MTEQCIFLRAHAKQNEAPSVLLLVTAANRPSSEAPKTIDRHREYLLRKEPNLAWGPDRLRTTASAELCWPACPVLNMNVSAAETSDEFERQPY